MLPELKNNNINRNLSENLRYKIPTKLSSNKSENRFNLKKKFIKKVLPPINKNNDIASKIKKSSLKKSISYLYKSLFPDEKNSMEDFLHNFSSDKYLNRPNWKYTFSPFKDEEKIRQDLMSKNTIMKLYNKMKKPSLIKKEFKKKPRMVQIIEDNYIYKNRLYNNPFDDELGLSNIKNKSIKINKNENEEEKENDNESEKSYLYGNYDDMYKSSNRVHFSNIYRGNIYPYMQGKILLSPINIIKIKDGKKTIYSRNDNNIRSNIYQYYEDSIDEEE